MDLMKLALYCAVLLLFAANASALPTSGILFDRSQCSSNCVLSLRSVNNLIVVARNSDGAIFKTLSFAMPADARLLYQSNAGRARSGGHKLANQPLSASTNAAESDCANMPGVCTASDVRTYATPAYYVFYTYTYVYMDGNLMEINVEETRVARNIIN